jgi:hypothetical protein
MKRLTFFVFILASFATHAQKTDDAHLDNRLQEYISFNKQLNFEKVMDYTHPKLFTIVPRKTVIKSLQEAFNGKEIKMSFDSMSVMSVGPVYKFNATSYRQIVYFMKMTVSLPDSSDLDNQELAEYMVLSFEAAFPGKKIAIDAQNNSIIVAGTEKVFAVKDPTVADWMFLGYDKSKGDLNRRLYPKKVQQYFGIL